MIEELERVTGRPVPREAADKIAAFMAMLEAENRRQNLIAPSTVPHMWRRHILDSAQLVRFLTGSERTWVDLGSGAGLPGVVVATLFPGQVTLVEPRRLRAGFLSEVVARLGLDATVIQRRAEAIAGKFDVISARAVAPLSDLLDLSQHLSTRKTLWLLPKGRNAQSELAAVHGSWQGAFHVEHSATDEDSYIVVGTGLEAKRA